MFFLGFISKTRSLLKKTISHFDWNAARVPLTEGVVSKAVGKRKACASIIFEGQKFRLPLRG